MSTTIDQRIVQMRFENSDFNRNVSSTITVLDRLKNKLTFKDSSKSLDELQSKADSVNFDTLSKSADSLGKSLTVGVIAKLEIVSNLIGKVTDAGVQMLKSLSIDQVSSGFTKYEQKLASVQTIMNATKKPLDEVNAGLQKLMWFTDETSYSFNDMVNNVSKFTSNQIDYDTSITAMMGIASAAGLAGASVSDASHAMDGFSKAIARGYMDRQNWQWIRTAHMDTAEFKTQLIESAVAAGTLVRDSNGVAHSMKGLTVSVSDFESAMSEGWLTSKVMLNTLGKFGNYADAVYQLHEAGLSTADAMKELSGKFEECGEAGLKASQESKTFADVINAIKDAVSSGWMQTFEILFGNFEEAKGLWAGLYDELYDIFVASGEARNSLLSEWQELGGREELLETLAEGWNKVRNIIELVRKSIEDVFPPATAENLLGLIRTFREFIGQFELSEEAAYSLQVIVRALILPIKLLTIAMKAAGVAVGVFVVGIAKLSNYLLTLFGSAEKTREALVKIFGDERGNKIADSLQKIILNIGTGLENIINHIKNLKNTIQNSDKIMSILNTIKDTLMNIGTGALDLVISAFQAIAEGDILIFWNQFKATVDSISPAFANAVSNFIPFVKNLFASAKELDPVNSLLTSLKEIGESIGIMLGNLGIEITNFVNNLDASRILIFGFGIALTILFMNISHLAESMIKFTDSMTSIGTGVSGVLKAITKRIAPVKSVFEIVANSILKIAAAFIVLAEAMTILANVPSEDLESARNAILMLIGALTGASTLLIILTQVFSKKNQGFEQGIKNVSILMLSFSAAAVAMAVGIKILEGIDFVDVFGKMALLSASMLAMAGVARIISTSKNEFVKGTGQLIAFAVSLGILAVALNAINIQNFTAKITYLVTASVMMNVLMSTIGVTGGKAKGAAAALLSISVSLGLLGITLNILSSMFTKNPEKMIIGALVAIGEILGLILPILIVTRVIGKYASGSFGVISKIGTELLAIAGAIAIFGTMDQDVLEKGTESARKILLTLGVISALTSVVSGLIKSDKVGNLGKGAIGLSAGIIVLTGAIAILGNMDSEVLERGEKAVLALIAVFGVCLIAGKAAEKAKPSIIAIGVAIGLATTAVMLLSLRTWDELLPAVVSFSACMIALGSLLSSIQTMKFSSLLGNILIISVAISTITTALIVLDKFTSDTKTLLYKATGMAEVILALGIAIRLLSKLETNIDFNSLKNLMIGMGAFLVETILALSFLDLIYQSNNKDQIISQALALSTMILAISGAVKIMNNVDFNIGIASAGAMGIMLLACSAALFVIQDIPTDNLFKRITGLSLLLLSLSAITKLLDVLKINFVAAAKSAASIGATIAIIFVEIMAGITAGLALSAVILTVGIGAIAIIGLLITALLGAFGSIDENQTILTNGIEVIKTFARGIVDVIAILSEAVPIIAEAMGNGLMAFFDQLVDLPDRMKRFDSEFLNNADNFISFLGRLASAMTLYLTGDTPYLQLQLFGAALANFAPLFAEFADTVIQYGTEDLATIAAVVETMAKIPWMLPDEKVWQKSSNLEPFGKALVGFAPYIKEFTEIISSGNINPDIVQASANAAEAMTAFAEAFSNDVYFMTFEKISKDGILSEFGKELQSFGIRFSAYAAKTKGITKATISESIAAAESVSAFADKLYGKEGVIQKLKGEKSLSEFGEELEYFAEHFVKYADYISQIDDINVVKNSSGAVKSIVEFANNIPSHNGKLQQLAGEKSLSKFGFELWQFGQHFVRYYKQIKQIDDLKVVTATTAAVKSISAFANDIPSSGGILRDLISGTKSLSNFGNELVSFGSDLSAFVANTSGVNATSVDGQIAAAKKVIDLFAILPTRGGWLDWLFSGGTMTMSQFGTAMKDLASGIRNAASNVSEGDTSRIILAAKAGIAMSDFINSLDGLSSANMDNFLKIIKSFADNGITTFVTSYKLAEKDFNTAGSEMVYAFANGMHSQEYRIRQVGEAAANAYYSELTSAEKQEEVTRNLARSFVKSLNDQGDEFIMAGAKTISAFTNGMDEKRYVMINSVANASAEIIDRMQITKAEAKEIGAQIMNDLAKNLKNSKESVNAANSSSTKIIDEFKTVFKVRNGVSSEGENIGEYFIAGIQNGISKNNGRIENAAKDVSRNIIGSFREELKIHSPSVEAEEKVGQYITQGIAVGIEEDNSAEVAAYSKAKAIVNSFNAAVDEMVTSRNVAYDMAINNNVAYAVDEMGNALSGILDNWGKTGSQLETFSSEVMRWQTTVSDLNRKINEQAEKVADDESTYLNAIKNYGEDSEEATKAFAKYISSQALLTTYENDLVNAQIGLENKLAEQIKTDKTVSDALVEKIDAIANIFSEEVKRLDTAFSIAEMERKLWGLTEGRNATEEETAARDAELAAAKINTAATKVAIAEREWQSIVSIYGEESDKAREKYLEYLNRQSELYELAGTIIDDQTSLQEAHTEAVEANRQAWLAAVEAMSKDIDTGLYDLYINAGFSADDLWNNYLANAGYNIDLAKAEKPIVQSFDEIINDAMNNVDISQVEATATAMFITVGNSAAEAFEKGLTLEDSIANAIMEQMSKAASSSKLSTDSLSEAISIPEVDISGIADTGNIVNSVLENLGLGEGENPITQIVEGIKNAFTGDFDWKSLLGESGAALLDGLVGGANSKLDWLKGKVGEWGGNILDWLNKVFDINSPSKKTEAMGEYLGEGLGLGLGESINSLITTGQIQNLGDSIINEFNENYISFYDCGNTLGDYVIKGLTNGIISNKQSAITAVTNLSNELYLASCIALDINSPSKIFENVGMYIDMGLANGIKRYTGTVISASTDIAELMVNAVQTAAEKAVDLADTIDENTITITPVIDLDEVEKGLKILNSMITAQEAITVSSEIAANKKISEKENDITDKDTTSGTTINYTQNNYSPKALSRFEIYRDTKNQLSRLKGVTSSK